MKPLWFPGGALLVLDLELRLPTDTSIIEPSLYRQERGKDAGDQPATNVTLQVPVPIPHTQYSIEFDDPGAPLRPAAAQRCLAQSRRYFQQAAVRFGAEQDLTPTHLEYSTVAFGIAPLAGPEGRTLKWGDAARIVDVFSARVYLRGYRDTWGRIVIVQQNDQQRQEVEVVGTARLSPARIIGAGR
ncbi:MAG: hypothetical protein Q9182_006632 [Xanthomendoza sp. 2 TL-2023]